MDSLLRLKTEDADVFETHFLDFSVMSSCEDHRHIADVLVTPFNSSIVYLV